DAAEAVAGMAVDGNGCRIQRRDRERRAQLLEELAHHRGADAAAARLRRDGHPGDAGSLDGATAVEMSERDGARGADDTPVELGHAYFGDPWILAHRVAAVLIDVEGLRSERDDPLDVVCG